MKDEMNPDLVGEYDLENGEDYEDVNKLFKSLCLKCYYDYVS